MVASTELGFGGETMLRESEDAWEIDLESRGFKGLIRRDAGS